MRFVHREAVTGDLPRIVGFDYLAVATRESSCDVEPIPVAARESWIAKHSGSRRPIRVAQDADAPERGVVGFNAVVDTIARLRGGDDVLADFVAKVADEDAMLLGRVTYQEWAQYWSTSSNEPFASHINSVPKYVVSRTLGAAPCRTSGSATLSEGSLADAVLTLKHQPGKNIGVHGSPTLLESLLQAELVDELRLEICPVIAGSGARLFHDGQTTRHLQLVDAKIAGSGVAILTHKPASGDAQP